MKKSGIAFHVHHNTLFEFCYDYDERAEFIQRCKPYNEQELRLRLFQLIPLDRLPKKGLATYLKAQEAYDKVREVYHKAGETLDKAREAYYKTREVYLKANEKALEKLHSELCPDCPWDGETIFSKETKNET